MNPYRIISVLAFLIICSVSALAQQPEWYTKIKQLKPLQSTYQDVVRIYDLASALESDPDAFHRSWWQVDSSEGSTQILLHLGEPCSGGSRQIPGWNIGAFTVVSIDFYPNWKKRMTPPQLPFPIDGYEVVTLADNNLRYFDRDKGIVFELNSDKTVSAIHFVPSESLDFMRCVRPENW
jgi:hypothetical protein